MKWLKTFVAFWYDFIVGDDWTIALAVVLAVGATSLVHHARVISWPIVPVVVAAMLTASIWRALRARRRISPDAASSPIE
jgi:hypothetical protein